MQSVCAQVLQAHLFACLCLAVGVWVVHHVVAFDSHAADIVTCVLNLQ